ncbi:MAG: histidine--tRNA ligase [Candidatus Azambacteria bacterium]|nr:histidine--tRNA ligase [Candidatus Azambacteria bacterium]
MKYQTPKGTRDFLPEEMNLRRDVINTLALTYSIYGFQEWDGPAFEYLDTLVGKSGELVVNEIYAFKDKGDRNLGLRFELTTSLARIIAGNPQMKKPLRLFNIGKVWRYEQPQAGRFREFLQADTDIFGATSMLCEVELLTMAVAALKKLQVTNSVILLNNRKMLEAQLRVAGIDDDCKIGALRSLDKLSKIGVDGVKREFESQNIPAEQFEKLMKQIDIDGDNQAKLNQASQFLADDKVGVEGIEELRQIINLLMGNGLDMPVQIDFSLVRGLDYYTGPIFEIRSIDQKELGSFAGGGRYDQLIQVLGGQATPAVGISFGIERLIEIIKKRKGYSNIISPVEVFVGYLSQDVLPIALNAAKMFREAGIATELDLTGRNLKKQLAYASSLNVKYSFIVFSAEEQKLKEMATQKEDAMDILSAISKVTSK